MSTAVQAPRSSFYRYTYTGRGANLYPDILVFSASSVSRRMSIIGRPGNWVIYLGTGVIFALSEDLHSSEAGPSLTDNPNNTDSKAKVDSATSSRQLE
jgi:hypothetical protein